MSSWPAPPRSGIGSTLLPGLADAAKLEGIKSKYSTDETQSRFRDVTSYNNFYEFGTRKSDPAMYAHELKTEPWSVKVEGLVAKPQTFALEDILKPVTLEERIYRLRCVEAWSMVIPWIGFPLSDLIKRVEPLGSARYVAFETLHRPSEMRGQRSTFPILPWPYVEGLRLDEAMHPLTILAVGLYGKTMPTQNGAPIRLVVPWKYGFKSIKSIVAINFVDTPAADVVEQAGAARVRLLFERQSQRRSPTLEPAPRAPGRRGPRPVRQEAADADVQRLRRARRTPLRRHGPQKALLMKADAAAGLQQFCSLRLAPRQPAAGLCRRSGPRGLGVLSRVYRSTRRRSAAGARA